MSTNTAVEDQLGASEGTIGNGTSIRSTLGETSERTAWQAESSMRKRSVSTAAEEAFSRNEWEPTVCENLTRKDLKHFRKYVNTTATHGVRRMFTGKSKIRRVFWIILFLVSAVFCAYNCITQILLLASWPTRLSVVQSRHDSLHFPTVTICNINGLQKSFTDKLNATDFVKCAFEVLEFTGTMLANASQHVQDCKHKFVSEDSDLLNYTILDLFRDSAQPTSRLIVDCSWSGSDEVVSCNHTNFTGVPTNNGYCYQFNGNPENQLITRGPGQRFAFGVTLNIEQEDYGPLSPTAGVYVTVHDPRQPPQPLQRGIAIPPGSHAYLDLQHVTHTYLGKPYGNCVNVNTPLDFFTDYSVAHCQQNSLFARVAKECDCIDPVASRPRARFSHLSQCTLNQLGCVLRQFVDSMQAGGDDDCDEACSRVDHEHALSFGSFPSRVAAESVRLMQNSSNGTPYSDEDVRSNFLRLSVFYGALIDKHFDQQPAYDGILLLADIGGQLGLFLGISIISVTEALVWIFDEIKDRLLWCKVVRRKVKETKHTYNVNKVALEMELEKENHQTDGSFRDS